MVFVEEVSEDDGDFEMDDGASPFITEPTTTQTPYENKAMKTLPPFKLCSALKPASLSAIKKIESTPGIKQTENKLLPPLPATKKTDTFGRNSTGQMPRL